MCLYSWIFHRIDSSSASCPRGHNQHRPTTSTQGYTRVSPCAQDKAVKLSTRTMTMSRIRRTYLIYVMIGSYWTVEEVYFIRPKTLTLKYSLKTSKNIVSKHGSGQLRSCQAIAWFNKCGKAIFSVKYLTMLFQFWGFHRVQCLGYSQFAWASLCDSI